MNTNRPQTSYPLISSAHSQSVQALNFDSKLDLHCASTSYSYRKGPCSRNKPDLAFL